MCVVELPSCTVKLANFTYLLQSIFSDFLYKKATRRDDVASGAYSSPADRRNGPWCSPRDGLLRSRTPSPALPSPCGEGHHDSPDEASAPPSPSLDSDPPTRDAVGEAVVIRKLPTTRLLPSVVR